MKTWIGTGLLLATLMITGCSPMATMGATTGMIAIIEIGIIATEIIGTETIATMMTGVGIVAMTATTGAIDNARPVQRRSGPREPAVLWTSPTFPSPEESPSPG